MKNKIIVHLMTKGRINSQAFQADVDAMEDLHQKYGIQNIIFYKGEKLSYLNLISKLEKFGIHTQNYANKDDLKEQLLAIAKKDEVLFVYTAMELLIKIATEVRAHIGLSVSDIPNIFRNKYLQREAIQKYNPELGIKFLKSDFHDLDITDIEDKVGYPFIIKPVDGVQSSGVQKINKRKEFYDYIDHYQDFHDRLKNRGVDNSELIIEEFITGKLFSIDYYVSPEQEIVVSKPVKVLLGVDVGIKDYANIARITTQESEDDLKGKRLKTFINATITACGVRNTFVHHEFKLTRDGKLKTIELNGRFGGGRVDIIQRAYKMNLFETLVNPDLRAGKLKEQNIVFNIYATKRGILQAFNNKLLARIKRRPSVYDIRLEEGFLGKEVGLTKDGFVKMGTISLASRDYEEIRKDFMYIKSKYKQLLVIDDSNTLLHKIKGYLNT